MAPPAPDSEFSFFSFASLCVSCVTFYWDLPGSCLIVLTALIMSNYGGRVAPGQLGITNIAMDFSVARRVKTCKLSESWSL